MDNTNKTFGARSHEEQERARDDYQARTSSLCSVGKPIRKKDSMQLLLGQAPFGSQLEKDLFCLHMQHLHPLMPTA